MNSNDDEANRRRFIWRVGVLCFGIPVALLAGLTNYVQRNPDWASHLVSLKLMLTVVVNVVLGIGGGWIWGALMWKGLKTRPRSAGDRRDSRRS